MEVPPVINIEIILFYKIKFCTGFEFYNLACRDFNLLFCTGVDACACGFL